jgi:WD40 repeat protein
MAEDYKYWTFISYSHRDNRLGGNRWGDWLHDAVENFKVPPELVGQPGRYGEPVPPRLYPAFQDEKELPTNADLADAIQEALRQSRYLVVICSPHSARSAYVNQEILDFKRLGRANRILAIMVDGEPNASNPSKGVDPALECFPEALRHPLGSDNNLDLTRLIEPIAADLRGADRREAALADKTHQATLEREKLRIIAGLLGVGFDDLMQRDKDRQQREAQRNRRLAAAFAALLLIAAGAAVFALTSQKQVIQDKATIQQVTKTADQSMQEVSQQSQVAIAKTKEVGALTLQKEMDSTNIEIENGRQSLLTGDQLAAAQHLENAYTTATGYNITTNTTVRVMLGIAMRELTGLTRIFPTGINVNQIEFDPKGKYLSTVHNDGSAQIWRTLDGAEVESFGAETRNAISQARFSPDGRLLIISADNGPEQQSAYLQTLEQGAKVDLKLKSPNERFASIYFAPDGTKIFGTTTELNNGNFTTRFVVWDTQNGQQISTAPATSNFDVIGVSAAGDRLYAMNNPAEMPISISGDNRQGQFIVAEPATGKVLASIPIEPFGHALLNPAGTLVVALPQIPAASVLIYSTATGKVVAKLSDWEWQVQWDPTGTWLITSNQYNACHLWNATALDPTADQPQPLQLAHTWLHSEALWYSSACFTLGGGYVALSTNLNFGFQVCDPLTGHIVKSAYDAIGGYNLTQSRSFRFTPDATGLAVADFPSSLVRLWDWRNTGTEKRLLYDVNTNILTIALSHDGKRAVTVESSGSAVIWDTGTGARLFTIASIKDSPDAAMPYKASAQFSDDDKIIVINSDAGGVRCYSADGVFRQKLATSDNGLVQANQVLLSPAGGHGLTLAPGSVELWNLPTLGRMAILNTKDGSAIEAAAFAPDGETIALADNHGYVDLIESTSGHFMQTLGDGSASLTAVNFNHANNRLLTADRQNHLAIWSIADKKLILKLNTDNPVSLVPETIHFSPDGRLVCADDFNGQMRIWDAATGAPGAVGATGTGTEIYSPEGSLIAGFDGGDVYLRDAQTRNMVAKFANQYGYYNALAFSDDGRHLAICGQLNAYLYDLAPETRPSDEIQKILQKYSVPVTP